MDVCKSEDSL